MPRRPTSSTAFSVVATVALLAAFVIFHPSWQAESLRRVVGLGHERVLPAPQAVRSGGSFAFAATQPGSSEPVGWDPCSPVTYAVNTEGMPLGGRQVVDRAIARISAATGLAFEDDGDTDRRPFTGSLVRLGGARPVVIAWATSSEIPELAGSVAGIGGAAAEDGAQGRRYYVSGGVAFDTDAFNAATLTQQPRILEAIAVHELAHVVGLAHVDEPSELMFADNTGQANLGPGDREGLALLGSVPCG